MTIHIQSYSHESTIDDWPSFWFKVGVNFWKTGPWERQQLLPQRCDMGIAWWDSFLKTCQAEARSQTYQKDSKSHLWMDKTCYVSLSTHFRTVYSHLYRIIVVWNWEIMGATPSVSLFWHTYGYLSEKPRVDIGGPTFAVTSNEASADHGSWLRAGQGPSGTLPGRRYISYPLVN